MTDKVKHCIYVEQMECDNCGFCTTCDLDPTKQCDDCMKCIGLDGSVDYNGIIIDKIITFEEYRKGKSKS